ncbi:MAG: N-formylglutamate amidohydrolase [Betaproteobacteria bacterium]
MTPPPRAARRIDGDFVVVTCEHGGNRIPAEYAIHFRGWQPVLSTHRGFDAGALVMARELGLALRAPVVASTVSRLLVDLNRSLSNPRAWSAATGVLPPDVRRRIARRHYTPYRDRVMALVANAIAAGRRVVHISSHSFTPVLDGDVRTADVGLLYDPARSGEKAFAERWQAAFAAEAPALRVRRNYPYAGRDDGLTSYLRGRFPATRYLGIELEFNQSFALGAAGPWRQLRRSAVATLLKVLR